MKLHASWADQMSSPRQRLADSCISLKMTLAMKYLTSLNATGSVPREHTHIFVLH
jgi:hypothetical protein